MATSNQVMSKVLISEDDTDIRRNLSLFCETINISPIRASSDCLVTALRNNLDLGGFFLYLPSNQAATSLALAQELKDLRPDLPLFLRVDNNSQYYELAKDKQALFVGFYTLEDLSKLAKLVEQFIFNRQYPNGLIAGIKNITLDAISSQFYNVEVVADQPYLIKDNIIFGHLFSMVPIEGSWCRGYLMMQTEQDKLEDMIASQHTKVKSFRPSFKDVNAILSEVTNLIWGKIKSNYFSSSPNLNTAELTQVPIIIDHSQKYISFGENQVHLCLNYRITSTDEELANELFISQKLVFNMKYSPEMFDDIERALANKDIDNDINGELEIF